LIIPDDSKKINLILYTKDGKLMIQSGEKTASGKKPLYDGSFDIK